MMEAVKQNWQALKYAGEEMRNNPDIVMEAVKQNWQALKYAGEELKNNSKFMMEAIKQSACALEYAGEVPKNNFDIVMEAVKKDWRALKYAGEELKNNPDIVMEAVKQNCFALEYYAGEELKNKIIENLSIGINKIHSTISIQHFKLDRETGKVMFTAIMPAEIAIKLSGNDSAFSEDLSHQKKL